MSKFKKKPIEIEAIQWSGDEFNEFPEWLREAWSKNIMIDEGSIMRIGNTIHINTLEGTMVAQPGDWIIKGINGELYPCKPDIFEKTYDFVE